MDVYLHPTEISEPQSEESTMEFPQSVMDEIEVELDEFAYDFLKTNKINTENMSDKKLARKITAVKDAWWDVFYALKKEELL